MREFFKSLRFKIILAVVAVILGGMLYAATTGGLATLPEQILSYVVYPVQRAAAAVSDSITGFSPFLWTPGKTMRKTSA